MRPLADVRAMLQQCQDILATEIKRLSEQPYDKDTLLQRNDLKVLLKQLQRPLETAKALDWIDRDFAMTPKQPPSEYRAPMCEHWWPQDNLPLTFVAHTHDPREVLP